MSDKGSGDKRSGKPDQESRPHDEGKNKIELNVIVNGTPTTVDANLNAPLRTVLNKALEQTQNTGQDPENWTFKDEAGNALDLDKKVGTFAFAVGVELFVSLKAGAGG